MKQSRYCANCGTKVMVCRQKVLCRIPVLRYLVESCLLERRNNDARPASCLRLPINHFSDLTYRRWSASHASCPSSGPSGRLHLALQQPCIWFCSNLTPTLWLFAGRCPAVSDLYPISLLLCSTVQVQRPSLLLPVSQLPGSVPSTRATAWASTNSCRLSGSPPSETENGQLSSMLSLITSLG